MNKDFISGFLSILFSKIGAMIIGLIVTPLLVRILGSAQYGDYAFILSVQGVLIILINAGINDGIRKFVAEEKNNQIWIDNVFGFYTRQGSALLLSVAIAIFLSNILGITSKLFSAEFELYFYLIILWLAGRQYFSIVRSALLGQDLERFSEPLIVLKSFLFGSVGLIFALSGFGVSGVLIGHIIALFTTIIVGTYFVEKNYTLSAILRRTPKEFPRRDLLTFNLQSIILIFLTSSLYHTDVLLLQPMVGSEAAGFYKAALVIAEFLWFVPNALQTLLLHSTSEVWAKNDSSEVTDIAARITRYTLLFSLLLIIGLAALAESFVATYYGAEFLPATIPLLLLLPGALGFAIARPILAIGQGKGELRLLIVATAGSAIINLVLNLILIPPFGMSGAAISTSIGYGSMLVFHGIVAWRIGFNPFQNTRLFQVGITALISATLIFGLSVAISSRLLSLIIVPPVGFALYSALALKTNAITPEELEPMLKRAPHPLNKWSLRIVHRVR